MRERLTDKLLKGLELPATGQIDIWDELMPSFGIRVSMGGRKSFMVGTRINGKFRRITLKPAYDALSLADARKKARNSRRRPGRYRARPEEATRRSWHIRSCRCCFHAGLCEGPSHAR